MAEPQVMNWNILIPSLNRLITLSSILITAILIQSLSSASAQTPEAKPRDTGSISGRVTTGEKGAAGIIVVAFGPGAFGSLPAARAKTDYDGNFRLSGLAAGTYNVTPLAPVFIGASNPYGGGVSKGVILAANETVDGIDFKLVRGAVVSGRVTDPDGRPVIDQHVNLFQVDPKGAVSRPLQIFASNFQMYMTDDRGRYRIYGVPTGHYKVSVGEGDTSGRTMYGGSDYYQQTFYRNASDTKASVVDLSEGSETPNVDMKMGRRSETYTASGHLIDSDGKPLAGIRMTYSSMTKDQRYFGGSMIMTTNDRGEFRVEGLTPGHWAVSIIAGLEPGEPYYSEPLVFDVIDSDVTDLEVRAKPSLTLSGTLVPEGIDNKALLARLTELKVYADVRSTSQIQTSNQGASQIAPNGTFQIDGLAPGVCA